MKWDGMVWDVKVYVCMCVYVYVPWECGSGRDASSERSRWYVVCITVFPEGCGWLEIVCAERCWLLAVGTTVYSTLSIVSLSLTIL